MQWSVDLHPVTGEWRIIDREGEIVCVSLHGEQHLAKIAAAPDMFEALKEARETIRELVSARCSEAEGTPDDWTRVIDAAIAKAEGRANLADAPSNPESPTQAQEG